MGNIQSAMMPQRSSAPPQKVGEGKPPAELKTINQPQATDRPTYVIVKLQRRARKPRQKQQQLSKNDWAKQLRPAMPGKATRRIWVIGLSEQEIDAWLRDVTATTRHATHLLIDKLQREKILETQAKQEQAAPVTPEVRSKPPAELKTIHQLKATDRPADVKAKLQKRAQKMLRNLCTSSYLANHLRPAML